MKETTESLVDGAPGIAAAASEHLVDMIPT